MSNFNYGSIPVTDTEASAASATATLAAAQGVTREVVGFDGSSDDQTYTVILTVGGTTILTMKGAADTSTGRGFNQGDGPIAADGEAITVVTTPASSGQCTANLLYRIIR